MATARADCLALVSQGAGCGVPHRWICEGGSAEPLSTSECPVRGWMLLERLLTAVQFAAFIADEQAAWPPGWRPPR